LGHWGHFDEIEIALTGDVQGFRERLDSKLLTVLID